LRVGAGARLARDRAAPTETTVLIRHAAADLPRSTLDVAGLIALMVAAGAALRIEASTESAARRRGPHQTALRALAASQLPTCALRRAFGGALVLAAVTFAASFPTSRLCAARRADTARHACSSDRGCTSTFGGVGAAGATSFRRRARSGCSGRADTAPAAAANVTVAARLRIGSTSQSDQRHRYRRTTEMYVTAWSHTHHEA